MNLVIYAHPYEESFNHAILEAVVSALKDEGAQFEVIDLYRDGFRAELDREGLAGYSEGKSPDPTVAAYRDKIARAGRLFFIFPVWWSDMPAILRGFFDKVFLPGFAYEETDDGRLRGLLKHIRGAVAFTTLGGPAIYHNLILGYPLKRILEQATLRFCGIRRVRIVEFDRAQSVGDPVRKGWLSKVDKIVRKTIRS